MADTLHAGVACAHLLIHAHDGVHAGLDRFNWMPSRLRALAPAPWRRAATTRTGVRVEDLQGREYFAAEDARLIGDPPADGYIVRSPEWIRAGLGEARRSARLIDLPLPAGTYHVTLNQGGLQRRYTVALEHGARFDLHLPVVTNRS